MSDFDFPIELDRPVFSFPSKLEKSNKASFGEDEFDFNASFQTARQVAIEAVNAIQPLKPKTAPDTASSGLDVSNTTTASEPETPVNNQQRDLTDEEAQKVASRAAKPLKEEPADQKSFFLRGMNYVTVSLSRMKLI